MSLLQQCTHRRCDVDGREVFAQSNVVEIVMKSLRRLRNLPTSRQAEETTLNLGDLAWLLHRPPTYPLPIATTTAGPTSVDDLALIERVMQAYKRSFAAYSPSGSGWDHTLADLKRPIHEALMDSDVDTAAAILRNPAANTLFWGFDAIAKGPEGSVEPHHRVIQTLNAAENTEALHTLWLFDALNELAEAIGARRVSYIETVIADVGKFDASTRTVDLIADQIAEALGFDLKFPNPYPGEFGLSSARGVIGFRAVQAIYQAWRIVQLSNGDPDFKVLEIGAGLGRTAYFAAKMGVKSYSIVDIPLTNAAQGYFLGRALGPNAVCLAGEMAGGIIVSTFADIKARNDAYDLVVNVDSWTEMTPDVARNYWDFARSASKAILSINHEHNPHTVRSLYKDDRDVRVTRYPYWMRRGYVEETIIW